MEPEALALTLPIRRLVEFLLRTGSIDSRFTGFDRALEGARLHRKLQRAAVKEYPDYQAEAALKQDYACAQITYTLEGRADGIFTDSDGMPTIDEIKTTTLPPELITGEQSPEHWAQAQIYAAIYARQNGLPAMRVRLTYFQVDEELEFRFSHDYTADALDAVVTDLLTQYAPWAKRAAEWQRISRASLAALQFPFPGYRPGQRAMIGAVYKICTEGGQLLCQAPTGIGKTMSVLFPALKAVGQGGPVFYLTARGTTRAAAENALALLRASDGHLKLRSVTLTAKDKICMQDRRECTPEACPYAKGYYDRVRTALWDALDTHALTADALQMLARRHKVCPFELGLDLSLWCDVVIGDYNYLFDPVVHLERFFDTAGDYLFLLDEAHNLPDRARGMHSAVLAKSAFYDAKKRLGKGKSSLKTALTKADKVFLAARKACAQAAPRTGTEPAGETEPAQVSLLPTEAAPDFALPQPLYARDGTVFLQQLPAALPAALRAVHTPLQDWLEQNPEDPAHAQLLELYFALQDIARAADRYDSHFVTQLTARGSELELHLLCLDPAPFVDASLAAGRSAALFSATLTPPAFYRSVLGCADARAVALPSPFPPENLGLFCLPGISTRYRQREASVPAVVDALAALAKGKTGNYLAFFPSYAYLQQVYEAFAARWPDIPTLVQQRSLDDAGRAEFLAQFAPHPANTLLGFAVMGGIFGEGVDLVGDRLIGCAIVGVGLPQVNPRQEMLRRYYEEQSGCGFDYAYRYPGMNKVLQAAGRVVRTPQDKGVVLLLDDRFAQPDTARLFPPHWQHIRYLPGTAALEAALKGFWDV